MKMAEKLSYEGVMDQWNKRALKNTIDINKKDYFWDRYEKKMILKGLKKAGKEQRVFDVGCGTGRLAQFLVKEGFSNVTGMDYAKEAVDVAKKRLPENDIFQADITNLPQVKEKFDTIILCRVLQSLPTPKLKEKALKELMNTLNPGGTIILIEGNAKRLTKHPRYNFYLAYQEWKNIFKRLNLRHHSTTSIPLATLLSLLDKKLNWSLRKTFGFLYYLVYFLDRVMGRINPGFVSHEFSMIIKAAFDFPTRKKHVRNLSTNIFEKFFINIL